MTRELYEKMTAYATECMTDAAHDMEHVWRVLGMALRLAEGEKDVNIDLLIAACLLHDIGRAAQFRDPSLDHAAVGGDMAHDWLVEQGLDEEFAEGVRKAIRSHRYRTGGRAETIEAQLLYDADKLEACGVMGFVRTADYTSHVGRSHYTVGADGLVDFREDAPESTVQEYLYKLRRTKDKMYTPQARKIAEEYAENQRRTVEAFCSEINNARAGLKQIDNYLS